MLDTAFPINLGFDYYENEDEFRLYLNSEEYILVWEIREKWEVSFVDKQENQTFITKGDKETIIDTLKSLIRNRKIDLLFDTK